MTTKKKTSGSILRRNSLRQSLHPKKCSTNPRFTNLVVLLVGCVIQNDGCYQSGISVSPMMDLKYGLSILGWHLDDPTPSRSPAQFQLPRAAKVCETVAWNWHRETTSSPLSTFHIHTYIHTYMHACMHTYIHTYVYTFVFIYPYHLYHFTFTYMTRASISYLYIYTDGTMKIPIPFATSWMELALKSSKETNRFLMGFGGLILEKHTW